MESQPAKEGAVAGQSTVISEETFNRLLAVQAGELELKIKEYDLRTLELNNTSKDAEQVLLAEVQDSKDERENERKKLAYQLIFGAFVLLIIAIIAVVGFYLDKDAIVSDLIKILSGLAAGAVGGYGYGSRKSKNTRQNSDD